MTIKKGEDWGTRGQLPPDAPVVDSDAALAALFTPTSAGRLSGPPVVGLTPGGDLARTLSAQGSADDLHRGERTLLPVDLAIVTVDARVVVMASSLLMRRSWWTGPISGAMNASYLGDWNVAPSGHPNDGRVDVFEANLSLSDRWKARSRLPSGTHLPHPGIIVRRLKTISWDLDATRTLTIDGVDHGRPSSVTVECVPDAVTLGI